MKLKTKTKALFVAGSAILLAGVFVLGIYIGYAHRPYVTRISGIQDMQPPVGINADFEPFWKVWTLIDEKYAGTPVNAQDRVYGAIKGLVGSLNDPYSVYFPPQDAKAFESTIQGSFDGIGMEVGQKEGIITVVAPLKNSPAEKAGIKAGDEILAINGKTTDGMTVDAAVNLMRGLKGTVLKLTIFHVGATTTTNISVTRDTITIPPLDQELRSDGTYVISLYNFDATSDQAMESALQKFADCGSKKLIIDLRGNPGGYLDASVNIASFFLPRGDVVVSEDFGGKTKSNVYKSKGYNLLDLSKIKVAILVDKGSASAAEILSGALNEHGVAPLIGETTYGKGVVQEVIPVTSDTTLKLTVAKWLTPNGTNISLKGLDPTIPVKLTPENTANHADPVLDRAIQYFKTGK